MLALSLQCALGEEAHRPFLPIAGIARIPLRQRQREIELTDAEGKGVYTAEVVIDKQAFAFQSAGNKQRMMAMTTVNGVNSYYTLPFPLDIRTAHVLPPELAAAANMQVREDRQRWLDLTHGNQPRVGKTRCSSFRPPTTGLPPIPAIRRT